MAVSKRVTLVADELLGYGRMGGLGTATSFLAVALGRLGHEVEILYIGDAPESPPTGEWARLYYEANVEVRPLAPSEERTEPSCFARARDVERSLRANPADVVITQDLAAPAYTALRLRQLGLGFDRTLFVVYCHGTRRWITDVARKVRVLAGALAVSVLEQASVELADVVVSPSAYLLDWMRRERWCLPQRSLVIPYLTRSAATGEPAPARPATTPIGRIAFFGRLEERKGLLPFAGGLNAIDRDLLRDLELEFVGRPTPAWTPDRVAGLLGSDTREILRTVSFHSELDQAAALARLAEPGTLTVIPSLEDNSPNAVYECLERGIPFVAGARGGIAELVAPEDRDRVLFDPTAQGVAAALSRALNAGEFAAARFAFDPQRALDGWKDVLAQAPPPAVAPSRTAVDVAIERREEGRTAAGESEWVVFLEDGDRPDEQLVETLVRAQSTSGADVVTCGVRLESGPHHYFLGDAAALGTLSNVFGTVALVRRSLLTPQTFGSEGATDPDWPLLAKLALAGAKIVSVPETLVTTRRRPGDVIHDPAGALAVVQEFERRLPEATRGLARLAAGLGAQAQAAAPTTAAQPSRVRRLTRLLPGR
jgi:glycosyltransferase involved in cell wall biosynthesis